MIEKLAGAVDIGGTKIMTGIVNENGRVYYQNTFPTQTGEGSADICLEQIVNCLKNQSRDLKIDLKCLSGVGVVCAGPVDSLNGVVENPYTLPGWEGFSLANRLSAATGLQTVIEHDVNGALLGEMHLRRFEKQNILMIAFGTGIGVAACKNGILHRGGHCFHPEMGHIIVDSDGPNCYCGHAGCFESLCSGLALNQRAADMGYQDFDRLFNDWQSGNHALDVFMEHVRRQFKNGIWNLMAVFQPEILIIGGGLSRQYFEFIRDIVQQDTLHAAGFLCNFEVLQAYDASISALVGASRLIFAVD